MTETPPPTGPASSDPPLAAAQCRVARALLGLEQAEIGARAGLSRWTVVMFEAGDRRLRPATGAALRAAFEASGIVFLDGRRFGAILPPESGDSAGREPAGLICPARCRAARAGLRLSQPELATLAGVGLSTVARFELGRGPVPRRDKLRALRLAVEAAGAELIESGGRGVLLRDEAPSRRTADREGGEETFPANAPAPRIAARRRE